ncbi:hypothetical protein KSS87_002142 [Heliosperma pusillum]|nr:hypothetical protein KSS87_002142 [Heliosperma pusillum]
MFGFQMIQRYVALKVQKSAQHYTEAAMDEITILKQIADGDPADKKCVVKLLDHFKHSGPNGQHVCMVFEYLGDNLLTLIKYSDYHGMPLVKVKEICYHILVGLDYLHKQLSIIHTDLKPENILLLSMIDPGKDLRKSGAPLILPNSKEKTLYESGSKDAKVLNGDLTKNQKKKIRRKAKRAAQECTGKEAFAECEQDMEASDADGVKGSSGGSSVHKRGSRSARRKLLESVELKCKLVDFGNACWTYKQFTNDIQTRQYRCPEVILGSKYSTSADMWSFACICFELATGDVLFDPHNGDNYDRDECSDKLSGLRGRRPECSDKFVSAPGSSPTKRRATFTLEVVPNRLGRTLSLSPDVVEKFRGKLLGLLGRLSEALCHRDHAVVVSNVCGISGWLILMLRVIGCDVELQTLD